MKNMANVAQQVLTQQPQSQTLQAQTDNVRDELPEKHINKFMARMSAIYGHKFNSLFRDESSYELGKSEWSKALAPLSGNQIALGLDSCKYLSEWNPNIPEFVRMACNLPSLEQCISRVLNKNNIDKVSYKVSAKLGSYSMRSLTRSQVRTEIRSFYDDVYGEVLGETMGNDEEFKPVAALPASTKPETPRADDTTAFANIREMKRAIKTGVEL